MKDSMTKSNTVETGEPNDSLYVPQTFTQVAGLCARWTVTPLSGAPIIAVSQDPYRGSWYYVDLRMWQAMQRDGIRSTLTRYVLEGNAFRVP